MQKNILTDLKRIEKLVLPVMIAFVPCYKVGIYLHQHLRPIQIKKHGSRARSMGALPLPTPESNRTLAPTFSLTQDPDNRLPENIKVLFDRA